MFQICVDQTEPNEGPNKGHDDSIWKVLRNDIEKGLNCHHCYCCCRRRRRHRRRRWWLLMDFLQNSFVSLSEIFFIASTRYDFRRKCQAQVRCRQLNKSLKIVPSTLRSCLFLPLDVKTSIRFFLFMAMARRSQGRLWSSRPEFKSQWRQIIIVPISRSFVFLNWTRSYKKNSGVELGSLLELTNQRN